MADLRRGSPRSGDPDGRDLGGERRGLADLRAALASLLPDAAELAGPPQSDGVVVHRIESVGDSFRVDVEDGVFVVRGHKIRAVVGPDQLRRGGVCRALPARADPLGRRRGAARQGVIPGAMVRIGANELEWEPEDWDAR